MAAQRDIEKQRPTSERQDVVETEQSETPKPTRFGGNEGKVPGVAADKEADAQARSASERAYNNEPGAAGVNMTPLYVDQTIRFSIDRNEDTGKIYLSIPVHNKMMEYDEWYELDPATAEKFLANPTLAHPMVEQARRREIDHLLLLKPGTDRGYPL